MQSTKLLPLNWVNDIFRRLTLTYGRDFLSRWEGQNDADVKAHWAEELGGFVEAPHCLSHALQNLPAAKPPTVLEFRDLCRKAPQAPKLALEAPEADPAIARAVRDAVKPSAGRYTGLDWALLLRRREEGETDQTPGRVRMTAYQRSAWREALGVKPEERAAA